MRHLPTPFVIFLPGCHRATDAKRIPIGKPDKLINLCRGDRWNVSRIWANRFEGDWIICEVDCDYLNGQMGVPYKNIAIINYPNAKTLTTEANINSQIQAISVGRYQYGNQFYEAYDCGDLATNPASSN